MSTPSSSKQWMSLEECGPACECGTTRTPEFAPGADTWPEGLSRRDFVRLATAGVAAASLAGCSLPQQKIVPYTDQPEKMIPGRPLHFATTLKVNGSARGVIVRSNDGRPTHIEGNPRHPMSLGACDAWTTAALYDLYDPDRLKMPLHNGEPAAWEDFVEQALAWNADWAKSQGAGLAILTAPLISPTEKRLLDDLFRRFPQSRIFTHDPVSHPERPNFVDPLDLSQADVIFSLESNFLFDRPDSLSLTRAFSRRRESDDGRTWNRLYVAETCPTITGIKADHRFPVAAQELDSLAAALLLALRGTSGNDKRWPWLGAMVDDLRKAGSRALILGGRSLGDQAKAVLAEANKLLGNAGKARQAQAPEVTGDFSLTALCEGLKVAQFRSLIILGGNPVLTAPADLGFAAAMGKVPLTVHLSTCANETSAGCNWVLNAAHDLEAWGDAEAFDGTLSITQPLIAPLYQGKSTAEFLALLGGGMEQGGYDLVRATWQQRSKGSAGDFEAVWHRWLREGVMESPPAAPPAGGPIVLASPQSVSRSLPPEEPAQSDKLWLGLRPSDTLWDGRHANNGWLMELADPVTKLTWDNAVLMSPATAKQLAVSDEDVVALHAGGAKVEAPVLIVPGHADRCVTLPLGYGRTACGSVGNGVGVNAYVLRTSTNPWFRPLDKIEKTGRTHRFARTQLHSRIEGRDLVHVSRVSEGTPLLNPQSKSEKDAMPSLYAAWPYPGHRWAMSLDLNSCIGCNACVIACQSENNIPVVGKEQVYMGRAMQWIRVDRYHEGPADDPEIHFQPVPCMQCENAPCEVVCPVAATQHDDEGLNVMIYNRCVGTRYCSNNCPYKVRRFNFLFYNAQVPETERLGLNPNVTVRSRGVMEKCTYCVQRIEEARIAAERDNRPLRGNDIVTACQSACPAETIVFGDLSEPESQVSKNRRKPGHYALLGELDTRPRTTYLEKRLNPNPALEPRPAENAAPTPI